MSILPNGLNGVTAGQSEVFDAETGFTQGFLRGLVKVSHHVHFAFAAGAGTGPAQGGEWKKSFRSVRPADGEL